MGQWAVYFIRCLWWKLFITKSSHTVQRVHYFQGLLSDRFLHHFLYQIPHTTPSSKKNNAIYLPTYLPTYLHHFHHTSYDKLSSTSGLIDLLWCRKIRYTSAKIITEVKQQWAGMVPGGENFRFLWLLQTSIKPFVNDDYAKKITFL